MWGIIRKKGETNSLGCKMCVNVCMCMFVCVCVGWQSDKDVNSEKQLKLPYALTLGGIPNT